LSENFEKEPTELRQGGPITENGGKYCKGTGKDARPKKKRLDKRTRKKINGKKKKRKGGE